MPSPRFPIPQGTLDMLVLQILSLEPAHGYGISQRLEQISRSVVQVNQGSLYPALHRLEQRGWLKAEWKESEQARGGKFYASAASGGQQIARANNSPPKKTVGRAWRERFSSFSARATDDQTNYKLVPSQESGERPGSRTA